MPLGRSQPTEKLVRNGQTPPGGKVEDVGLHPRAGGQDRPGLSRSINARVRVRSVPAYGPDQSSLQRRIADTGTVRHDEDRLQHVVMPPRAGILCGVLLCARPQAGRGQLVGNTATRAWNALAGRSSAGFTILEDHSISGVWGHCA